jgi:hypothetical protein
MLTLPDIDEDLNAMGPDLPGASQSHMRTADFFLPLQMYSWLTGGGFKKDLS